MFKTTTQKTVDFGWFSIRQKPQTVELPELPTIPPPVAKKETILHDLVQHYTTKCWTTSRGKVISWGTRGRRTTNDADMKCLSARSTVQMFTKALIEKQTLQTQKRKHTFGCKETRAHTAHQKLIS